MINVNELIKLEPQKFISFLKENDIKKFHFIFDDKEKKLKSSHEVLKPLADYLSNDKRDFMNHEGMFFQLNDKYDTLLGAFVHKTNRGQGAGGVRYWNYNTIEDFLRDGIRLAKGMTRKNALANLWWGGGKGVICHNPEIDKYDPEIRKEIYREFGEFITSLNGCYITAEDVGTNVNDMAEIFYKTRFTTCIPQSLGGSGNPSVPTARGVVSGIEASCQFLYKSNDLSDKTVMVQGLGNVGTPLIRFLFEKNVKKVIGFDINPDNVNIAKKLFYGKNFEANLIPTNDFSFIGTECDIFAPCATGAVLNDKTIPQIKAKIICGAANNQLEDSDRDDQLLFDHNIIYVPDFLVNRMGIVNCANEQYGYVNNDPFIEKHLNKEWDYSVYQTTLRVLQESKVEKRPTEKIAVKIADNMSEENHPIFGHRGKEIIASLFNKA